MKRTWTSEELLEHFTLLPDELNGVGNKSGATRLGFAVLFKCFRYEGRFLRSRQEAAPLVVRFLATQVGVDSALFAQYAWEERTIEAHRAQIRAIARHEARETLVIPILVRPVDWKDAPFAHLQALPSNSKPLTTWRKQDRALTDVAIGIRRAIENLSFLVASASRTALPKIWTIPYPRNPFFLGRETELELMHRHLQAHQAVAFSQP